MLNFLSSHLAIRIAWTLVHFLWEGALLGLSAWLALFLLRRERPQIRYAVACGFLMACMVVPVFTFFNLAPARTMVWDSMSASFHLLMSWGFRMQTLLPWFMGLWVTGVFALSLRALSGWIWLQQLRAMAQPYQGELEECLQVFAQESGVRRQVRFLESMRVKSPMTMGVFRPIIVLPLGFFLNLDPVAVDAVLAHELAHIRRFDVLVNGIQCVVETLLFFHPAVWWISRRIRAEREHCCDDAAVEICGDPILFAEALCQFGALKTPEPILASSIRGGSILERMRRLLGTDASTIRIVAPTLSLVLAFTLGCSAWLLRQQSVRQRIAEVAMTGAALLNRTIVEGHGTIQGMRTWVPEHPAAPEPRQSPSIHVSPSMIPDVQVLAPKDLMLEDISSAPGEIQPLRRREMAGPSSSGSRNRGNHLVTWPAGVSHMEGASLPFGTYSPYMPWQLADINAHRMISLMVQPGENLVFKLKGESSKITMEALPPKVSQAPLPWCMAIEQANRLPHQRRATHFKIQNPTSEPQVLNLMIYGCHGYSYRIDLERSGGEI